MVFKWAKMSSGVKDRFYKIVHEYLVAQSKIRTCKPVKMVLNGKIESIKELLRFGAIFCS